MSRVGQAMYRWRSLVWWKRIGVLALFAVLLIGGIATYFATSA